MRVPKEIAVLLVLLAGVMIFVLWYVADRKAKARAEEAAPRSVSQPATSVPAPGPTSLAPAVPQSEPVALGGANDKQTIDFSSGQPVVKDAAEDKAAMEAALKDISAATEGVTFGPSPKKTTPASTPAPSSTVGPTDPKP